MRVRINLQNVAYYIRQRYGFKTIEELFKNAQYLKTFKEKAITKIVTEFTGYSFKDGKLTTYNPYTDKNEVLNITSFEHINTKEALLKELSTLHKSRMVMLEKSRKKLIELSKKKDRDKDLEAKVEQV